MNAAEYLARVGFAALCGGATQPDDEDDPASIAAAKVADHHRVRDMLIEYRPSPIHGRDGALWIGRVTWPDRVGGLVTWAGKQSLVKIIANLQSEIAAADDLFEFRAPIEGATGIDALSCQDAIDIGFSPARLGMPVLQRPALELLAIHGLETVPLVSFGFRDCGFLHDGRVWRFPVETRDGGYYHRWGQLREQPIE